MAGLLKSVQLAVKAHANIS